MSGETAVPEWLREGGRVLYLWFAIGLATTPGAALVVDRVLIGEPYDAGLYAGQLLAIVVAAGVNWRYPDVDLGRVWRFASVAFVTFAVLAAFTTAFDGRTSGSLYPVIRVTLAWIAALAAGVVAARTDDWRDLLPGR